MSTDHYAEGAVDFIFAPIPPEELPSPVSFVTTPAVVIRPIELLS